MLNPVPRKATDSSPAATTARAVTSARWTNGTDVASSIRSATLCIVFVQSRSSSAPPFSSTRASAASNLPADSQSPARCISSTGAKSTEDTRHRAEW